MFGGWVFDGWVFAGWVFEITGVGVVRGVRLELEFFQKIF